MSRLTPRAQWQKAIKSDAFPREHRVVRGTLLCLIELMTSYGELRAWRDDMVTVTGLPPRTLDRHLQRAVEAGWLVRETPAGKRRQAVYVATIPTGPEPRSVRHSWRAEDQFCAPSTRVQNSSSVRHLVANSIRQSTHDSEYLAVDDQRGTRSNHDETRADRQSSVQLLGIDPPPHSQLPPINARPSVPTLQTEPVNGSPLMGTVEPDAAEVAVALSEHRVRNRGAA